MASCLHLQAAGRRLQAAAIPRWLRAQLLAVCVLAAACSAGDARAAPPPAEEEMLHDSDSSGDPSGAPLDMPLEVAPAGLFSPWNVQPNAEPLPGGYELLTPPPVMAPPPLLRAEPGNWMRRPLGIGWFHGGYFMDDPSAQTAEGGNGYFTGLTLSWDVAPRWGLETRLAFAYPAVEDPNGVAHLPNNDAFLWDTNLLWYPWPEGRWRPFLTIGSGVADFDYLDNAGVRFNETYFSMPIGMGVKYRFADRLALRFDLKDNFTFGSGLQDDLHNLSLTAGLEARFGSLWGSRSYWPWEHSASWW